MIAHSFFDLLLYLLLYAFLAWAVEVCWYSVRDGRFVNRGFISLPFRLPYGIALALLIQVLPTLGRNYILQFIVTLAVLTVVRSLAGTFTHRVSRIAHWELEDSGAMPDNVRDGAASLVITGAVLLVYHIIHPVLATMVLLLPDLLVRIIVIGSAALLALDFAAMLYAVRHGGASPARARRSRNNVQRMADRITAHIWKRLEKAYPGIETETVGQSAHTFAKGLCWDKLVWVFLLCALLGDVIETFYCGLVDGEWMNRSSVLYGPFSFVWGIGAVVLTVSLRRLAKKSDRWVFIGGFVIGGVYEYMCSVFTELVFGTVFWDYSDMPLNIGGRTNALFCFFWGLLAVVWVKILYPPMDQAIEKVPPVAGKTATWAVVFAMACNGLLTGAAMLRYNTRAVRPAPTGIVEQFLDSQYDDDYIERRWPNMIVTEPAKSDGLSGQDH